MKREYIRTIQVFENHFVEFKKTLSKDVLKKMYQVFMLIMTVEMVPVKFLKPITSVKALMKKYFELKKEQENEK